MKNPGTRPHQVNAKGIIDPAREMHYRFHQRIDPSLFPQVHDFYELTLLTSGCMYLEVNGRGQTLRKGAVVLLRPGDVHSRRSEGECTYINLAFPAEIMMEMFRYLDDPESYHQITRQPEPVKAQLTDGDTAALQDRLEKLNLLPNDRPHLVGSRLRWMMLDIVSQYIVPALARDWEDVYPGWLTELLKALEDSRNFDLTLDDMVMITGCTKEHVCRSFRKFLGSSPTAYLNGKRLNYAANLLLYSDKQVIDVAYASGFQSLSRFYHAFKEAYHVSPLEYRGGKPRKLQKNQEKAK